MKKRSVVFACFMALVYVVFCSDIDGPAHHGHGDLTGATTATIGHCQTHSCHGGNNPVNVVALQVLDTATMLPVTTYRAYHTYLIKLTGDATAAPVNLPGFGFQVSAALGNHTLAGSYTIPDTAMRNMHTFVCGATTVVEHTNTLLPDAAGVNKYSVAFYWTAPAPFTDSVSFYALLNAVNGDGGKSGDYPDAAPTVTIYEDALDLVVTVGYPGREVSLYPNPATTVLNIAADEKITSVAVSNISGRVVFLNYYNTGQVQINVAGLSSGIYFVKVNGVVVRQFLKQ